MEHTSSTEFKELARNILEGERAARKSAVKGSALPRVCEKLGETLGQSAGVEGFRSLLKRSLALANEEFLGLEALQIKPDGSLDGFDELKARFNAPAGARAEIILLAHLLELMVTFFGPELTLRLLLETWPATNMGVYLANQRLLSGSSGQENHALAWTPATHTSRTVAA